MRQMGEPQRLIDKEAREEHHSIKEPILNYDPEDPEPVNNWRW